MKKNENCFIGLPSCGYVYESAKMVFLAAPSDDEYKLKIRCIESILEKYNYETYVALRRMDPAKFSFCTKICSKIIQSQFCIALLDPSKKESVVFPNPNVHFEYGMMLAQNKSVIPFQREDHSLAFNIFPLDTVKYNEGNFESKVMEAIEGMINAVKAKESTNPNNNLPSTYFALKGFVWSDLTSNNLLKLLYGFGQPYFFNLLDNGMSYQFFGNFEETDAKISAFRIKQLVQALVNKYNYFKVSTDPISLEKSYGYLVNGVDIDILIGASIEKEKYKKALSEYIPAGFNGKIVVLNRKEMEAYVDEEMKKLPSI